MPLTTVDSYLAGLDETKRRTLENLRQTILEVVPEAEECISYGSPAFKVQGKVVAGFAAHQGHLSYLPHSGRVLPGLAADLGGYDASKGALKFAVDAPLPKPLVELLVRTRLRDIDGTLGS